MKLRLASLAVAALFTSLAVVPAQAAVETFEIDAVHSTVLFRVKHMNTSYAYGRFNGMSGKVAYDAAAPEASSIEIKVDAATVDTADAKRDAHLKGADLFDVAKFPTMTFASTAVKKAGDNLLDVTGNLTLHGVTKSITIRVEMTGTAKGRNGESLIGFESVFQIKRSEYGMSYGIPNLADDVKMTISLECMHK